ncbi:transmembrane protein 71 [Brachyhypopomus gauderio]|uniref:transmembrane protein 71 n=1 Tax=Brachyhypopomus gauderio TaxID=698409 RepID=UPI0040421333
MALFFQGAITSSPVKTIKQEDQACNSFDASFLSDCSYECFSTNPVTGSVCACRRSPRLLANGYYVLTEDSIVTDDEGNLTLTPTQTNISYKENLVRIFRRRRKVRTSLASLLSNVSQSCQSWLGGSVFSRSNSTTSDEVSSWLGATDSAENDPPICFTYDPTETLPPPDKQTVLEEEYHSKVCPAHDQPSPSVTGLLDVPPPTESLYNAYYPPANQPSDGIISKAILLFIITFCLCATVFSRWVAGGIAVVVAVLYLILLIRKCKFGTGLRWNQTKTEDITSRNE